MPSEKSSAITSAPLSTSGREDEPVPAAISKILIPGFGAHHLDLCLNLRGPQEYSLRSRLYRQILQIGRREFTCPF